MLSICPLKIKSPVSCFPAYYALTYYASLHMYIGMCIKCVTNPSQSRILINLKRQPELDMMDMFSTSLKLSIIDSSHGLFHLLPLFSCYCTYVARCIK